MSDKPILFLDVDGVLNCFDESKGVLIHPETPNRACVPHGTDLRLSQLALNFEIVWATAWFGAAHRAFKEHLGLPEQPWEFLRWNQYKLTEILKFAGNRPWAWADDDIQYELNGLGWIPPERFLPDNSLLVGVEPNTGLSDDDVNSLLDFAYNNTPVKPDETEVIG